MDPLTLGLMAGGQAVSGGLGALGSYLSSQQQLKAAKQAQGAITNSYGTATAAQQPYYAAGQQGLNQLSGNFQTAVPGQYQTGEQQPGYTADQFNYQQSPGYQYQLDQANQNVMGSAAARGAGLSGATLKSLAGVGQGLAAQDYGQAFNRYMQGRQQNFGEYQTGLGQYNLNRGFGAGQQQQQYENQNQQQQQRLGQAQGLAGIGQQAAGNLSNLATGYGQNLAGLYGQMGNAQAAGTMGMAQGFGNAASGIGNAFATKAYLGAK